MNLTYQQFLEYAKPRRFEFGELCDGMIIWYEYKSNVGYIHVITHCNWSHRGSVVLFNELLPHILKIYIEREFRGETWEIYY